MQQLESKDKDMRRVTYTQGPIIQSKPGICRTCDVHYLFIACTSPQNRTPGFHGPGSGVKGWIRLKVIFPAVLNFNLSDSCLENI